MSFLSRLFGGGNRAPDEAPEGALEDAAPGQGFPADGDELTDDLKQFLYPQDEFLLRQQRWAAYKQTPPKNEPLRDPRLAALGRLVDRTRQPTDEQIQEVVRAYKRRPREFDRALEGLRATAHAAARDADVVAARDLRLGDPRDPDDQPELDETFRAAVTAAAEAVAVQDLASPEQRDLLAGPWCAGFGPLP